MRLTVGSVRGPTSGSRLLYSRLSCTFAMVSPPISSALHVRRGAAQLVPPLEDVLKDVLNVDPSWPMSHDIHRGRCMLI